MSEDVTPYGVDYRRPGRPGVTQIDVDRAADKLLHKGERPSIEKIRAQLGGSPNTLAPLLDDWWRRLAARVAVGPGAFERLPGTLAHIAEAFFLHALEEARNTAEQEEKRGRDALTRAQHEVDVRSHVLSLREKELQAMLEQRDHRLAVLELQLREQTVHARKLQISKDAAETRAQALSAELDKERERQRSSPARARLPRTARRPAAVRGGPRKAKPATPARGARRKTAVRRARPRRAPSRKLRR